MEDFTIAIYCFIDDYMKVSTPWENPKQKMLNSEVITTALVASRFFGGNYINACHYMVTKHGCLLPHKSNFIRQLNKLSEKIMAIFIAFGQTLKELNTSCEYIIDSFPVAVCRNIRIKRGKLLKNKAYRGYNHSKREYFYGFKVMLVTTTGGIPVEYFIVAGSVHDLTAFKSMNLGLSTGSRLYADSAFIDYLMEDNLWELDRIKLMAERKSNSKRKDSAAVAYIKKTMRKQIENTFSGITNWFPRKIHAVTAKGFLLKVFLFVFAYSLDKTIS